MSDSVAKVKTGGLVPAASVDAAALAEIRQEAESASGLPYFRMYGSNSKEAKIKKIKGGNYGMALGKTDPTDLGDTVDIIICSARLRAVDTKGGKSFYKRDSEGYEDVKTRSKVKDSGCMHGPEILVWVGEQEKFATWHLNSPTLRNISDDILNALTEAVTVGWRLAEGNGHTWDACTVSPCPDWGHSTPEPDLFEAAIEKFKNPKGGADSAELAGEAEADSGDRD